MNEPAQLRAFVNGTGVAVPRGATVLDAVRALDPDEAAAVEAGTRAVTDSRGLPADARSPLSHGAVLRVVPARPARAGEE